jgi:peroxiredoxin
MRFFTFIVTMTWFAVFSSSIHAAKFNRVVEIGQVAPTWKNLKGVDGKAHSSIDLKDAKATIVVFTCNHCPVAKNYENRLNKIVKNYKKQKVEVVAISVSLYPSDNLAAMTKRAKDQKYSFRYLQDSSQKIGQQFGALCTPHVFLLDSKRKIAYMGKIDDDMYEDKVTEPYLLNAIDAVLKGKSPEVTETKPVGCPIQFDRE